MTYYHSVLDCNVFLKLIHLVLRAVKFEHDRRLLDTQEMELLKEVRRIREKLATDNRNKRPPIPNDSGDVFLPNGSGDRLKQ